MGYKDDFLEAITKEEKIVYFEVDKGDNKKPKIKFKIRPLIPRDLFSDDLIKSVMLEISKGQSVEESARIAGENVRQQLLSGGNDSLCELLLTKGVTYPKLINSKENIKDDELPFSYLSLDMKIFLLTEIAKISPLFKGK